MNKFFSLRDADLQIKKDSVTSGLPEILSNVSGNVYLTKRLCDCVFTFKANLEWLLLIFVFFSNFYKLLQWTFDHLKPVRTKNLVLRRQRISKSDAFCRAARTKLL